MINTHTVVTLEGQVRVAVIAVVMVVGAILGHGDVIHAVTLGKRDVVNLRERCCCTSYTDIATSWDGVRGKRGDWPTFAVVCLHENSP